MLSMPSNLFNTGFIVSILWRAFIIEEAHAAAAEVRNGGRITKGNQNDIGSNRI